jgi:hypothetical protein
LYLYANDTSTSKSTIIVGQLFSICVISYEYG